MSLDNIIRDTVSEMRRVYKMNLPALEKTRMLDNIYSKGMKNAGKCKQEY